MTEDAPTALSHLTTQVLDAFRATPDLLVIGIANGGVALAEHLHAALEMEEPLGILNPLFHRDDLGFQPIPKQFQPTSIPFEIDGRTILLIDDVFATGRTLRAVLNELFDHGRPEVVRFATLFDTCQHKLPYHPDFTGQSITLPEGTKLKVRCSESEPTIWTAQHQSV